MGFIIFGAVYIGVCEVICKLLRLEEFNKRALVYAIVGVGSTFLVKVLNS